MESSVFTASSYNDSLFKNGGNPQRPNPNAASVAVSSIYSFRSVSICSKSLSPIPKSLCDRPRGSIYRSPLLESSDRCLEDLTVVKASSAPDGGGGAGGELAVGTAGVGLMNTLQLGLMFGIWYLFNISFNIYNKQVLKVYPYPITLTTFQLFVGIVLIFFMWSTNLYKRPKLSSSQLLTIFPLAIIHTLGNLFTNISLAKVSVSFTHTIKAMEPFFTVILSAMFLDEMPTLWVTSSLVPIVGGVVLASLTEVSFNWAGFWSAMASNLTNQSRNVLSKKFMAKEEESLDNITLFSVITVMSFFLSIPITLFSEGIKFTPLFLQSAGLNLREVYIRSLLAALCFHAYQQASYMILALVSPVTHSVGNCVKRVVVIAASVLFFKTPLTLINSIGTGVALAGVFIYSRVKRIKSKSE